MNYIPRWFRLVAVVLSVAVAWGWFVPVQASDGEGRHLTFKLGLHPDNTWWLGVPLCDPQDCWAYVLTSITVEGRDSAGNQTPASDYRQTCDPHTFDYVSDASTCTPELLADDYYWLGEVQITYHLLRRSRWSALKWDEVIGTCRVDVPPRSLWSDTSQVTLDVHKLDTNVTEQAPDLCSPKAKATPTPSVTAASARDNAIYATVTTANLNLREGPGTDFRRIMTLHADDQMRVLGRNEPCSWLHVTDEDVHGWISADYVRLSADCSAVPLDANLPQGAPATFVPGAQTDGSTAQAIPGLITDFETWGSWQRGDEPYGQFVQSSDEVYRGRYAGKFTFDLPANRRNFVVYRKTISIPGQPDRLKMWVYGDGSGAFLNVWLQDANGQRWQFGFGAIDHFGWQELSAPFDLTVGWPNGPVGETQVSNDLTYPLSLFALVIDGLDDYDTVGTVYFDDLTAVQGAPRGQTAPTPIAAQVPTPSPTLRAVATPTPVLTRAAPAIVHFWADSNAIEAGACTTLVWNVENVREVYWGEHGAATSGVTGYGSQEVCPDSTRTYDLRAILHDGSQEIHSVTVVVTPVTEEGSPQYAIWADRTEIGASECATVFWHALNVREVYFGVFGYEVEPVTGDGAKTVCPEQTTLYVLRVILPSGNEDYPTVNIAVSGPPNASVPMPTPETPDEPDGDEMASIYHYLTPSTIRPGECAEIRWESTNVAEVFLGVQGQNLHTVALNGSEQVCPQETTVYTLLGRKASGSEGTLTITLLVEGEPVSPGPSSGQQETPGWGCATLGGSCATPSP